MTTSDVIVLSGINERDACAPYYVDSVGFKHLHDFYDGTPLANLAKPKQTIKRKDD
jgi:hypothetical protein